MNPSVAMFKGFASGCLTKGQVWLTQLVALSSYAPISIFKIEPFAYCPHGPTTQQGGDCGFGRVEYAKVPGAFTEVDTDPETGEPYNVFHMSQCWKPFAVAVTNLEYINDENIAVTILRAAFSEYDPGTGMLNRNATNSSYEVWFLSTETMAFSKTPWNREASLSSQSEGMLCPAMRRLPNVGSLTTELIVAGVELVRKIFDIGISLPGLVEIWGKQQSCPFVTHGHSLLRKCGSDLLALDDFFEAVNRANAHFWRSFSLIAERIRDLEEDQLANLVDGVAYYGESTISPLDAYKSIMTTVRVPAKELGTQFIQGVLPMAQSAMANELAISANPMRMAQFSYDLVASVVSEIIPLAIRAGKDSRHVPGVSRWCLFITRKKFYVHRFLIATLRSPLIRMPLIRIQFNSDTYSGPDPVYCLQTSSPLIRIQFNSDSG